MVIGPWAVRIGGLALPLLAAEEQAQPLLLRLPPEQRGRVVMALLGLVLLLIALVALAWLGGRQAIRLARKRHAPTPNRDNQWYRKPLVREPPASGQSDEPN